jgi:predicted dehydrogenase
MSISFAIIGCGNIGKRHAEYIQAVGKLVAVCDIEESRAKEVGEKFNAAVFNTIENLLSVNIKPDVVVICTPNGLHASHSILALQAGCHVLCEKPMAINSSDCYTMIKASEKANRKLFVVKQNRFNPPVVAVKKILEENKLGKIFSVQLNCFWNRDERYYKNSWKGTLALDGGILFTQFSHFIDLLYWMIGDVKEAKGIRKNFEHKGTIEFEDAGAAILKFENGEIGSIHYTVNSYKKNMEGSLTIFGEKGTVKIGGQYLNKLEYQQISDVVIQNLPAGNSTNDYGFYEGSMSNHDKVYLNLLDVLQNNVPISAGSQDGLKTVEIIEKIYAASPLA